MLFDAKQSKNRDEIYLYLVDKLAKANERPSPVVAEEMTNWLMGKLAGMSLDNATDIASSGMTRVLGREPNKQQQVLSNLKTVLGDQK